MTNRRLKYVEAMKAAAFRMIGIWVPANAAEAFRQTATDARAANVNVRAADIEWLAAALERTWDEGSRGERHPFDVMAADTLHCLDGYTAPLWPDEPGGGPNAPPHRAKLS
jgi:hypothetical protein